MKKTSIYPMPELYDRYINLVEDVSLNVAFDKHFTDLQKLNTDVLNQLGNQTYAENKWTVKEILCHLMDWEHVFAYRALLFARREGTIPSGHDENIMAANSKANNRNMNDLIENFVILRSSTTALFKGFDDEDLLTIGQNWNMKISVLAIGFTIVGHQIHHFDILKNRYLPLLGEDVSLFN